MPKTIRIIINLVFSLILFILLISKTANTFSDFNGLAQRWAFDEPRELFQSTPEKESWLRVIFFVFGVYPAILLTAAAVWLRGVPPIVLSALGGVMAFVLYLFEMLFVTVYEVLEVDIYMGFDPLISAWTYIIAFFVLAISIAELVIGKKKRSY